MKRIVFVCTGNTCRSPMAEGMLRRMAREAGLRLEVRSAGTAAAPGAPMAAHAQRILRGKGIDEPFASKPMTEETVRWADLILTMAASHKRFLLEHFPQAMNKVFTLKEFTADDPQAAEALAELDKRVSEWQIKQATGQAATDDEMKRIMELQLKIPDADIPDPFGGPRAAYESCAAEIERALAALIERWKEDERSGGTDI